MNNEKLNFYFFNKYRIALKSRKTQKALALYIINRYICMYIHIIPIWVNLGGPWKWNMLVYLMAVGYIFCGHLVYILWPFDIFYGHLLNIFGGNLVNFVTIWNILGQFGIYFVVIWCIFSSLVCCPKKNLATLLETWVGRSREL
jgi:hypothetical protein